jgi:hypothetical protein
MYKFVVIILVSLISLSACVKEDTSTNPVDNPVDTSMAMSRVSGTFGNGPYGSVNGKAKIYFQNNQYTLALENFNSSNCPDLQSVSGNQQYPLPENTNFSDYRYALIHCQQYNHLFGSAELK